MPDADRLFITVRETGRRALDAVGRLRPASAPGLAVAVVLAVTVGPGVGGAHAAAEAGILNTQAPAVAGGDAIGSVLTCSPGTWRGSPTSFAYAWLRNGTPIAGQSADSYTVAPVDAGAAIACEVTASAHAGEYEVTGLPSGSDDVEFEPFGLDYLRQFFSGASELAQSIPVVVKQGVSSSGVDAALATAGSIAGRVTDTSQTPLSGFEVCAEASSEPERCAETNANGEYTIGGLTAGSYKVMFDGEHCEEGSCFGAYESQYYEEVPRRSEAKEVTVSPPNTTAGIDASLVSTGATGSISGEAQGEGVGPLEEVEVCAFSAHGGTRGCQETNSAGAYTISKLPPGEYTVLFAAEASSKAAAYISQWYDDKASEAEAEAVHVSASGLTPGIDATLKQGATIAGKLTSQATGQPVAEVEVCAYDSETAVIELIGDGRCATSDAEGDYEVVGLPSGEYEVATTRDPASDLLASSTLQEAVTVPETKSGVSFSLQSGASIAGRVTNSNGGAPITGLEVCALGGSEHNQEAGCTFTDGNGEYAIAALEAGSYVVEADGWQCVEQNVECGDVYLGGEHAGEVAITPPGVVANIDFSLTEGGRIAGMVTSAASGTGLGGVEVDVSQAEGGFVGSALTRASESASATSAAVAIPASVYQSMPGVGSVAAHFKLVKKSFDAKKDDLDLVFEFSAAGKVSWKLTFPNAEVGFKDGLELPAALAPSDDAVATAAKKGDGKGRKARCNKSEVKHKGKCGAKAVNFSAGSRSVSAGKVELVIHASAAVRKALKKGKKLHVSGRFAFAVAGSSATLELKDVVKPVNKTRHHRMKYGRG